MQLAGGPENAEVLRFAQDDKGKLERGKRQRCSVGNRSCGLSVKSVGSMAGFFARLRLSHAAVVNSRRLLRSEFFFAQPPWGNPCRAQEG